VGCGSVPIKARKGGWRYLDTGQVLIESACSVERVDETLCTLLPLLPDVHYYRFNPVDERCDMELDETDPAIWLKLENTTDEYIQENSISFKGLAERLLESSHDEKFSYGAKPLQQKASNSDGPFLGLRRGMLLVEASNSPDSGRVFHHARSLETYCAGNGIRLSLAYGGSTTARGSRRPYSSPLFTGSFPSTSLMYSPELGPVDRMIEAAAPPPPFALDGGFYSPKSAASPPESPKYRDLALPVLALYENLRNSPQLGIVHLALQNDSQGSILRYTTFFFF
ncbi:hypothetical protein M569_12968, partial [Genlisea aurea]